MPYPALLKYRSDLIFFLKVLSASHSKVSVAIPKQDIPMSEQIDILIIRVREAQVGFL